MSDSDTDGDCLSSVNNVFGYPNESTIVRVRGPDIDSKQTRNFDTFVDRQHITGLRPHNFQSSFRGFAQSSMFRGRASSSTQSMCSNVSKADTIVAELKSGRFNKAELYSINEAVSRLLKGRKRKRMEWRRKRKLKEGRRPWKRRLSGYDSGELGSDSSMSNDDCLSIRTGITAINGNSNSIYTKSRCGVSSDDARSVQTDINNASRTIKTKAMLRDHAKQDSFMNILSIAPRNVKSACMNGIQKNNTASHSQPQKHRFQNSFLLPSQRFAPSQSVLPIPKENNIFEAKTKPVTQRVANKNHCNQTDSERDDNIFSEATDPDKSILKHPKAQRKRNLNSSDEAICSENKKTKLSLPKSGIEKVPVASNPISSNPAKAKCSDFVFAKPQVPVQKLISMKKCEVVREFEKVTDVAKIQSLTVSKVLSPIKKPTQEQTSLDEQSETMYSSTNTSELSMRPSFMKRKLFTQTLDVTENKNCAESSPSVSPAKGYSEHPKERNKARKLVTSQSCLSREIPSDDNNLLDLIHKIVPPDRMNVTTNTTQKIEIRPQGRNTSDKKIVSAATDKEMWDVTAILTTCRDDYHSDTFTDEEIFTVHDKKESNKLTTKNTKCNAEAAQCKKSPLKEKLSANEGKKVSKKVAEIGEITKETTKTAYNYAHAFWNCDTESEGQDTPKQKKITKESSTNTLSKHMQEASKSKNSLVVKNIKSVLDVTKSSIEDIGNHIETITSNRSLRIRAAKALKELSMNTLTPCRREDLQQSICDTLKRGKSTREQSSSSTRIMHSKNPVKKNKVKTKPSKKAQENNQTLHSKTAVSPVKQFNSTISTRSKLNLTSKPYLSLTCFNKDESESPHLNFTRRGRPRKLNNVLHQPALHATLQNKSISPNTSRGRPRRAANGSDITNKSTETRSAKIKTQNAKSSPKPLSQTKTTRSRILETPKGPNLQCSSKLKIVITKIATEKNNAKLEQRKITSPKDTKQDTHKTGKDHKKVLKTAAKESNRTNNATKATAVAPNKKILSNSNIEDYFGRTRSSRNRSFLSPVKEPSPLKKRKNGVTQVQDPQKNKGPATKAQDTITSDKENAHETTYRRSRRSRQNTTRSYCDGETPKRHDFLKPNGGPSQKTNGRVDKLVEVPDSPSVSIRSLRSVRDRSTRHARRAPSKWDLGIAKATIGVVPFHCVPEEPSKTLIDDDSKSVTVRSIASTSVLSRGGRSKFLHVW